MLNWIDKRWRHVFQTVLVENAFGKSDEKWNLQINGIFFDLKNNKLSVFIYNQNNERKLKTGKHKLRGLNPRAS
jgi:hypothetical protein